MSDWKAKLKALGPCPEAYRWANKHKTFREAWRMCENGEWMSWLLSMCDENEALAASWQVLQWCGGGDCFREEPLRIACIILDFMPDPPRLPEIQ